MRNTQTHSLFVKLLASLLLFCSLTAFPAYAQKSVPRTIDYQGVIFDAHNNPITTPLSFRFSLWSIGDYTPANLTDNGTIATSPDFSGYQEVQNITPDRNGNFRTAIGVTNPLPSLNPEVHKYLQIEAKPLNAPDTQYEILDVDGDASNTNDRKLLSSAPYAISTEALTTEDTGNGPGKIPTLDANGKLPTNSLPEAITGNVFTLNSTDNAGDVKLEFGSKLKKVIKWAEQAMRFEIGDSLFVWGNLGVDGNTNLGNDASDLTTVSGNLTVNGKVNGRDVAADGARLDKLRSIDQTAQEVPFSSTLFSATNVYDALVGLKQLISTLATQASELAFTATPNIAANNTQAAVETVSQQAKNAYAFAEVIRSEYQQADKSITDAFTAADAAITKVLQGSIDSMKADILANTNAYQAADKNITAAFASADDAIKTAYQAADGDLKNSIASTQTAYQAADAALKTDLLKNDSSVQTTLQGNIDDLAKKLDTVNNSIVQKTSFNWDFIPAAQIKTKRLFNYGRNNKGIVALRDGKITGISISSNPIDSDIGDTYFITKSDNGLYDASKQMTSISLSKTGTGDVANSAFNTAPTAGAAGLSFRAGDVLRAYIDGKDEDYSSNLVIELEYQSLPAISASTSANLPVSASPVAATAVSKEKEKEK